MMKRIKKRMLAFVLAALMLLALIPSGAFASDPAADPPAPLRIASMSDIHLYPKSLQPDPSDEEAYADWRAFCVMKSKQFIEGEGLLDSAFAALDKKVKEQGIRYLVVSGDLSKDGEYEAHKELAARFEEFMREHPGFQVFVINGNHDINNSDACTFVNGREEPTRKTTPQEFAQLYRNCGYSAADLKDYAYESFVSDPAGRKDEKAGMLSYAVTLPGGYRLIAMDGGKYSPDSTKSGTSEHETGGAYSPELLQWILKQCAQAREKGQTVIGLTHFNLVAHFQYEALALKDFPLDNWEQVCDQLADAGMHFAFTGHMHSNDIAKRVSDNGNALYDCETGSLSSFPNPFRVTTFDNTQGVDRVTANFTTWSADCEKAVTVDGKTIERPYAGYSFNVSFGKGLVNGQMQDANAADFLKTVLRGTLGGFLTQMQGEEGIQRFLRGMGLDLDALLEGLLGDGINVGAMQITPAFASAVVDDLLAQLQSRYIDDSQKLFGILDAIVDKLAAIPVSTLPNAKFVRSNTASNPMGLNYGSATKPGTLGDIVLNCLYYMYAGNEDIEDDPFTQDVIRRLNAGDTAQVLVDTLLDVVMNDLLGKELLPSIVLHTTQFKQAYPELSGLIELIETLVGPDPTLATVADFIAQSGLLGQADSLDGLLQGYLDKYLTESQLEALGMLLGGAVADLCTDTNPTGQPGQDAFLNDPAGVTYVAAPETVVPTADDYRLPSDIAVTFGEDEATARNINWYTKASITATDVQIVPYAENPVFTDTLPGGVRVTVDTQRTGPRTVSYPGVDLGVIGLLDYSVPLYRHVVAVTGLEAGRKYSYRVGDASRGWWSPAGVLETADGSDAFTFLHMSDSQAQNEKQYAVWGNLLNQASRLYPKAGFVLHTGDFVDHGGNANQWRWGFNAGGQALRNLTIAPAAGNHEAKATDANTDHFALAGLPKQDTSLGAYYSFDYNNAHFMVLNTNNLSDSNALSDDQLDWLKADAAASDAQWKIVAMHKAPYSNGSHYGDADVTALRDQLSVLMPALGIDLVLEGHDHVYLRTKALDAGAAVQGEIVEQDGYPMSVNPQGTVYVISACSGVKNYNPQEGLLKEEAASIVPVDAPVFSAVRIAGNALYFDAVEVNGEKTRTIDSFAIRKEEVDAGPVESTTQEGPSAPSASPDTGDAKAPVMIFAALAAGAYLLLSKRRAWRP